MGWNPFRKARDLVLGGELRDYGELPGQRSNALVRRLTARLTHKEDHLFLVLGFGMAMSRSVWRVDVGPGFADALRAIADDIDAARDGTLEPTDDAWEPV